MPVVFTSDKCKWSGALLSWMLSTIPEQHQGDIHLIAATEEVSHVPCIVDGGRGHVGLEQCTSHLRSLYMQPPDVPEVAPEVEHVLRRDLSQYQSTVKSESNLEDRYNQLLASRSM